MVLDTSALLAILLGEPASNELIDLMSDDSKRLISAATALEAMIVIEAKKGEAGARELDLLLHRARIDIVAFDSEQTEIARNAYRRFGKGRHPAGLNFGDCFAYALSIQSGEPLLFQGDDFLKTDVAICKTPVS